MLPHFPAIFGKIATFLGKPGLPEGAGDFQSVLRNLERKGSERAQLTDVMSGCDPRAAASSRDNEEPVATGRKAVDLFDTIGSDEAAKVELDAVILKRPTPQGDLFPSILTFETMPSLAALKPIFRGGGLKDGGPIHGFDETLTGPHKKASPIGASGGLDPICEPFEAEVAAYIAVPNHDLPKIWYSAAEAAVPQQTLTTSFDREEEHRVRGDKTSVDVPQRATEPPGMVLVNAESEKAENDHMALPQKFSGRLSPIGRDQVDPPKGNPVAVAQTTTYVAALGVHLPDKAAVGSEAYTTRITPFRKTTDIEVAFHLAENQAAPLLSAFGDLVKNSKESTRLEISGVYDRFEDATPTSTPCQVQGEAFDERFDGLKTESFYPSETLNHEEMPRRLVTDEMVAFSNMAAAMDKDMIGNTVSDELAGSTTQLVASPGFRQANTLDPLEDKINFSDLQSVSLYTQKFNAAVADKKDSSETLAISQEKFPAVTVPSSENTNFLGMEGVVRTARPPQIIADKSWDSISPVSSVKEILFLEEIPSIRPAALSGMAHSVDEKSPSPKETPAQDRKLERANAAKVISGCSGEVDVSETEKILQLGVSSASDKITVISDHKITIVAPAWFRSGAPVEVGMTSSEFTKSTDKSAAAKIPTSSSLVVHIPTAIDSALAERVSSAPDLKLAVVDSALLARSTPISRVKEALAPLLSPDEKPVAEAWSYQPKSAPVSSDQTPAPSSNSSNFAYVVPTRPLGTRAVGNRSEVFAGPDLRSQLSQNSLHMRDVTVTSQPAKGEVRSPLVSMEMGPKRPATANKWGAELLPSGFQKHAASEQLLHLNLRETELSAHPVSELAEELDGHLQAIRSIQNLSRLSEQNQGLAMESGAVRQLKIAEVLTAKSGHMAHLASGGGSAVEGPDRLAPSLALQPPVLPAAKVSDSESMILAQSPITKDYAPVRNFRTLAALQDDGFLTKGDSRAGAGKDVQEGDRPGLSRKGASVLASQIEEPEDQESGGLDFTLSGPSSQRLSVGMTPRMHRHEAAFQVIRQIGDAVLERTSDVVELRLEPEELGHVRFRMTAGENSLNMTILADRPETLDLLRRHVDQLARHLDDLGCSGTQFRFGEGTGRGGGSPGVPVGDDRPEATDVLAQNDIKESETGLDIRI